MKRVTIFLILLLVASFAVTAEENVPEKMAGAKPTSILTNDDFTQMALQQVHGRINAQDQRIDNMLMMTAKGVVEGDSAEGELKLLQQQLVAYEKRFADQDKRINDLFWIVTVGLAIFTIIVTLLVLLFSWRAKSEAERAAREEAVKEASSATLKWLDNDGRDELLKKIDGVLEPEVSKALKAIEKAAEPHIDALGEHVQKAEVLNEEYKKSIDKIQAFVLDKDTLLTEQQQQQVAQKTEALQSKAPKEYQFDDWFVLGLEAYKNKKYEIAVDHFDKASKFSENPMDIARSLLNKGVILGQLNRSDEAVAVYDEVVHRYGDASEPALQEPVAQSLFNKGMTLGWLEQSEEAMAAYGEVVHRYGDASEPALQELVASALNNLSFGILCKAKKVWVGGREAQAKKILHEALATIEGSLNRRSEYATALGNKGYILFLLGEVEEAKVILKKALELGDDALREATLADAEIHPLPQDEAFKVLINAL